MRIEQMGTSAPAIGTLVALLSIASALPLPARAADGPVLVLAPEGDEERLAVLQRAMEAHLSGYDVEVQLGPTGPLAESFPAQAEQAAKVVEERAALAAIWVDHQHEMVFVLVAAPEADQILQRPLPAADEPWSSRCDAISSMVHSALAPWLGRVEETEPIETDEATAAATAPAQVGDGEIPPGEGEPVAEPPPSAGWLTLQVRAGYGPVVVNRTGGVQHGGRVAAGAIFGDHLEAEAAIDLLFPLAAENVESDDDTRLVRWPLRIAVAGFLSVFALDLGLKIGLVIDFTSIRGRDTSQIDADTERVNPGFASALFLRYRILEWLAVWIDGGIDIFSSAYDYLLQGVTVIRYSAVQGRVSGGLAFLFQIPTA
jgi:hypothetical protein